MMKLFATSANGDLILTVCLASSMHLDSRRSCAISAVLCVLTRQGEFNEKVLLVALWERYDPVFLVLDLYPYDISTSASLIWTIF